MSKLICEVCGYAFEGDITELPEDWKCPACGVGKEFLKQKEEVSFREETVFLDIDDDNPAIARDPEKCVKCGNCRSICQFKQGVYGHYDIQKCKKKTVCVECGQCTLGCPTGAMHLRENYHDLKRLMQQPGKIFVFQTSPSVRVSLAEEFGGSVGEICTKKLVGALRALGANYVFDTTFGADLTVMEEAHELAKRLNSNERLPLLTSCCPAWVKFVEIFYPEYIPNISSCKSPISMQHSVIKNIWAKTQKIDPKTIISVAVTPCLAKKAEILREKSADFVIPVRELAKWIKEEGLVFEKIAESEYDSLMSTGSGGGVIFGNSGGVMEAALRTANFLLTGQNLENIEIKSVRSLAGFVESEVNIGGKTLRLASVSGLVNARKLLEELKSKKYDFVEVMACLGGCMAGGGQPINNILSHEAVRVLRSSALYELDKKSTVRNSHENEEIKKLYANHLKTFGSPLLHTSYSDKSDILG